MGAFRSWSHSRAKKATREAGIGIPNARAARREAAVLVVADADAGLRVGGRDTR